VLKSIARHIHVFREDEAIELVFERRAALVAGGSTCEVELNVDALCEKRVFIG
jgi:hypothetical protein